MNRAVANQCPTCGSTQPRAYASEEPCPDQWHDFPGWTPMPDAPPAPPVSASLTNGPPGGPEVRPSDSEPSAGRTERCPTCRAQYRNTFRGETVCPDAWHPFNAPDHPADVIEGTDDLRAERDDLRAEVERLQQPDPDAEARHAEVLAGIEALRRERDELSARLTAAEAEVERLLRRQAELLRERTALRFDVARGDREVTRLRDVARRLADLADEMAEDHRMFARAETLTVLRAEIDAAPAKDAP